MLKRSRAPSTLTRQPSKKKVEKKIPCFLLRCQVSDWPNHLVPHQQYMVQPDDKNDSGVATYQRFDGKWALIGSFPLAWFDVTPVRKWIAAKKAKGGS